MRALRVMDRFILALGRSGDDMRRFVEEVAADRPDLKSLGIRTASLGSLPDTAKSLYQLG